MDHDTFIITVYCSVAEHSQHLTAACPIRHGGFSPQLSDVEVITMAICGEFFKLPRNTDLFGYFRARYWTRCATHVRKLNDPALCCRWWYLAAEADIIALSG